MTDSHSHTHTQAYTTRTQVPAPRTSYHAHTCKNAKINSYTCLRKIIVNRQNIQQAILYAFARNAL